MKLNVRDNFDTKTNKHRDTRGKNWQHHLKEKELLETAKLALRRKRSIKIQLVEGGKKRGENKDRDASSII